MELLPAVRRLGSSRWAVATTVGLLLSVPASARAEETCLDFRADRVVLDPALSAVELHGDILAQCGPYTLHAQQLSVRVNEGDVDVTGPASIALCSCDQTSVGIGFDRAKISPGGDVKLTNPTLRVGKTDVFWLPWLWVRAPDRVGVLLPRIAWRGDGDMLLGTGVHLPWRGTDGELSWTDLYVSGYTRGGFEVEPSLVTPTSRTTVRFDRMNGDLWRVDAEGFKRTSTQTQVAFRADAALGKRGVVGLVDIRDAAKPVDEAAAFVEMRPFSSAFVHAGVMGTGMRGHDSMVFGPMLIANASGALAKGGTWQAMGSLRVVEQDGLGAAHRANSGVRLAYGAFLGPTRLSVNGQTKLRTTTEGSASALHSVSWSSAEMALPLIKRYALTSHTVEPFAQVLALGSIRTHDQTIPFRSPDFERGARWIASAGVRNALGPAGGNTGARWELSGGKIGGFSDDFSRLAMLSRLHVNLGLLDFQGEGAITSAQKSDGVSMGGVVLGRASVGDSETVSLHTEFATRSRVDCVDARAFAPLELAGPVPGLLSDEGTSLSVGGHVPLGAGLRIQASSDWDLTERRWLSLGSGVVLDSLCKCIRGRLWVSRRIGREGTDAWLEISFSY